MVWCRVSDGPTESNSLPIQNATWSLILYVIQSSTMRYKKVWWKKYSNFVSKMSVTYQMKWNESAFTNKQHSFQTVYKKIKSQSNNPCACQDRTKQTHQNFAMYIFICCYRAGLAIRFRTKNSDLWLSHNLAANIWKQDKKKMHWKNDKSSYELNIDNSKNKICKPIYIDHLLK